MGQESHQLVRMWTAEEKLDFTNECIIDAGARTSGFKVETYMKLSDEYFKQKGNKLFTIGELWSDYKQGDLGLHEWITKIHNLVSECNYYDN